MIVKMTILRFLSDDKEKIGKIRPEGPRLWGFRLADGGRGGAAPRGSQGSALKSSSIQEHRKNRRQGIGASGGSRKNRRHAVWCRRESKPSQPLGTG